MADTGIITGASCAYPDGIRIVGTPIGTKEFAAAFVEDQVTKHSERLKNVLTLGLVSPEVGLLLIHYCCMTRLNYLMQLVPICAARVAYTRAYDEIITCWRTFMEITDVVMDGHMTHELIALPTNLGGQGLIKFHRRPRRNAALAGCMAANASDLNQTVLGLHDLGDPDTPVPRWGYIDTVWDELAADGENVRAVLPDLEEIYLRGHDAAPPAPPPQRAS